MHIVLVAGGILIQDLDPGVIISHELTTWCGLEACRVPLDHGPILKNVSSFTV